MRFYLFAILSCLAPAFSPAQQPVVFAGTKTPYHPRQQHYTPPPRGFAPVFINYTGRHGARFLTKAGSDINVLELLSLAEKNKQLTDCGKQIKAMAARFLAIEKDNYENITLLGHKEQAGIGERMLHNYPAVFRGNGIDIVMTHKIRTQQSAGAFLRAFGSYRGKKKWHVTPDSLDNILRFYDLSPGYNRYKKSAAVRKPVDSLNKDPRTVAAATHTCVKLFQQDFARKLAKEGVSIGADHNGTVMDAVSFSESLYDLYCVQFSIPVEMEKKDYTRASIDFGIAFEEGDLRWLAFKNGAEDFLEKGAGIDTLGIQVRVALPLLADYITSTEAIVSKTGKTDAILRFTHAEAIAPFATLLGIPEASSPSPSIYQYSSYWQAETVIPLSANIQWIVYSNGREYLLKVLLNEKETSLPVATASWPYYRWEDVKNYYLQKLNSLQTTPQQDMHKYLAELR